MKDNMIASYHHLSTMMEQQERSYKILLDLVDIKFILFLFYVIDDKILFFWITNSRRRRSHCFPKKKLGILYLYIM